MRTFLTFLTLLCAPKAAGAAVAQPTQVQLTSHNMDVVLRWERPLEADWESSQLRYTTAFRSTVGINKPGCLNTSALHCDFSTLDLPITVYGTYIGSVRAQRGQEVSAWVESSPLTLDVNTTIGPPDVRLVSNGVHITINIRDPVFRISSLRGAYDGVIYKITYWREGEEDKAKHLSINQNPTVVLSDLEPRSSYCVKVQIKTQVNLRPSLESKVTCEKTTEQDRTAWLEVVVILLVMVVVVTVVTVVVVHRKKLSNFLCPKDLLPQHFTNILENSSLTSMVNYRTPVETYDQMTIITMENNTDEECPLVAEEDHCTTVKYQNAEESRQASNGKQCFRMPVPKAEAEMDKHVAGEGLQNA